MEESYNYKLIVGRYLYHWPLFLSGLLITLSISFIYLRLASPVYKTKATVLIKDRDNPTSALNELGIFQESKVVENEIEIMRSKALVQKVIENLGLNISYYTDSSFIEKPVYGNNPVKFFPIDLRKDFGGAELVFKSTGTNNFSLRISDEEVINGIYGKIYHSSIGSWKIEKTGTNSGILNYPIIVRISDESSAALQTIANLSITPIGQNSSILELTIEDQIPDRGIDVLNQVMQEYNKAAVEDKNKVTASTLRFVNERLDSLGSELQDAEKDVENFKSNNGFINISSESQLFLDQAKDADQKLSEINVQLSVINGIERYANQPSSSANSVPSTLGVNDPVLLRLISSLSDLETKRATMLANGTVNNPMLLPVEAQIASTRKAILESIGVLKNTLMTTRQKISANLSGIEGSIRTIPGKERQFIGLQRKQTIKDNLVTFLLQKREEAAMTYASAFADSRIVDQAYSVPVPVRPKRAMAFGLAIFMGLFVPFAWIFSKELFNTRIQQASEIKSTVQVPVAGELVDTGDTDEPVINFEERGMISEQFRALRTNLKYLAGKKKQSNVVLITSSISGEGKSFVSLNLGKAFALNHRKTVIVEFDLRKPKVAKYAGISGNKGLSSYLIGQATEEELIQPSGIHPSLFMISAGHLPPNPAELMEENTLIRLISFLRNNFDEIIIDTPPVGLVPDALLLRELADVSLYIVRLNYTDRLHLEKVGQLYKEGKFPGMALVINGERGSGRYGYGYDYSYYSSAAGSSKPIRKRVRQFMKRF